MLRYDLIPKIATDRLAYRFTGFYNHEHVAEGGALKYGEGNWERGLPTSDVINHIIHHLTNYQDRFRDMMSRAIRDGYTNDQLMDIVREHMQQHSAHDDDLAGAMWGICVLMHQEMTGMFHDDEFPTANQVKTQEARPLPASTTDKEYKRPSRGQQG